MIILFKNTPTNQKDAKMVDFELEETEHIQLANLLLKVNRVEKRKIDNIAYIEGVFSAPEWKVITEYCNGVINES